MIKKTEIICTDEQRENFVSRFMLYQLSDGPISINYKKYLNSRTEAQNATYWMWLDEIRDHLLERLGEAHTTYDIHEHMCELFLPTKVITIARKITTRRTSTSSLKVKQFKEYLDKINYYCSEHLELFVSLPEEYKNEYKNEYRENSRNCT